MKMKPIFALAIASTLCFTSGIGNTADQDQQRDQSQLSTQDQKMIYGWDLMTTSERNEHRAKMLTLKTEQERTAFREEHHKLMLQRAQERGVTLPDTPMQRGTGQGGGGGGGKGNQ